MYRSSFLFLVLAVSLNLKAQNNPFEPSKIEDGWNIENLFSGIKVIQKMDSLIAAKEFKEISSLVIAHNGKIVFENYYNKNTPDTKHNTRSCTKTIEGTHNGKQIQEDTLKSVQQNTSTITKVKNIQKREF